MASGIYEQEVSLFIWKATSLSSENKDVQGISA